MESTNPHTAMILRPKLITNDVIIVREGVVGDGPPAHCVGVIIEECRDKPGVYAAYFPTWREGHWCGGLLCGALFNSGWFVTDRTVVKVTEIRNTIESKSPQEGEVIEAESDDDIEI